MWHRTDVANSSSCQACCPTAACVQMINGLSTLQCAKLRRKLRQRHKSTCNPFEAWRLPVKILRASQKRETALQDVQIAQRSQGSTFWGTAAGRACHGWLPSLRNTEHKGLKRTYTVSQSVLSAASCSKLGQSLSRYVQTGSIVQRCFFEHSGSSPESTVPRRQYEQFSLNFSKQGDSHELQEQHKLSNAEQLYTPKRDDGPENDQASVESVLL